MVEQKWIANDDQQTVCSEKDQKSPFALTVLRETLTLIEGEAPGLGHAGTSGCRVP